MWSQTITCYWQSFFFNHNTTLFQFKTEHSENDAITSEVVGQAHMENYALKVFLFADNEDRAGRFNKYTYYFYMSFIINKNKKCNCLFIFLAAFAFYCIFLQISVYLYIYID